MTACGLSPPNTTFVVPIPVSSLTLLFVGRFSRSTVCMADIRQSLASPRHTGKEKAPTLNDLLSQINTTAVNRLKAVLNNLKVSTEERVYCI